MAALTSEAVVDRVLDSIAGSALDAGAVAQVVRQAHEALEGAGLAVVDALTIPAEPERQTCLVCGGEGVVGGLIVSDDLDVPTVDERCGRCKGRGWVPAADADIVPWEPVT